MTLDDLSALHREVDRQVRAEASAAGQMTLGAFIAGLERLPQDFAVVYDFDPRLSPADLDSYRGFYEQLALDIDCKKRTVSQVLANARAAMGACFQGYKGGDYWMTGNTMVWAAEYGDCGRRVVGLHDDGQVIIIKTAPYLD